MCEILTRSTHILDITLSAEEITKVAKRSRGTPRVGNRLLSRVRDFVEVSRDSGNKLSAQAQHVVNKFSAKKDIDMVDAALDFLDVDMQGLQPFGPKVSQNFDRKF